MATNDSTEVAAVWRAWGPQFELVPPPVDPSESGWSWLADLTADDDLLELWVRQSARALAAMTDGAVSIEPRVAASQAHMTLVGRVVALSAALTLHGLDADAALQGRLWWRPDAGLAFPLAGRVSTASGRPSLQGSWVQHLTARVADRWDVSAHVVWGNVAATVQGTLRTVARVAPDRTPAARAWASALLDHRDIAASDRGLEGEFRRASCCLLYRATADRTPICGDCVLLGR